ncbi:hypothetical protein O0L34_g13284 [Tuta absoluta]|nr:hypothetical protein O0L34_g13284 [Tuta absoluta]
MGENRTILEMLGFVVNINILLENQLPNQVCDECESILHKADAFKRRCLETEMFLAQQTEIDIQGQIADDFSKNSNIKNEFTSEMGDSKATDATKTFTELTKPSNSALSVLFDNLTPKDEKIKIFADVTVSKHKKNSKKNSKASQPESVTMKVVKVENNDFDDDISFDFDDPTYEMPLIEFKQEVCKDSKGFTCSCGTICETKDDYRLHLFTTNCAGFKPAKNVKREKKTKGNAVKIKNIVCSVCKEEFNSVKACRNHKRKHTKEEFLEANELFECTLCMRKFNRKSAYTNHMKNHERKSTEKFTCEACKREFRHKAHLDNHILNVHTRDKGFSCDMCTHCFSSEASLQTHKESHNVEKKHVCEVCKKGFYMLSTLNDHMRVHTGEKPYLCSICGKGFSQKTNLAQHVRRHQGLKPYKCEDCDRRFVSKGELTAHTRSHSGAHPFVCPDCGSGFTTSSSLVKHRRTHTGERPYACDLCPMRFAASGTLKNHRRTHTGEKPFQCSYCEKAFVQRHDLISHIRGHTGERPYTCGCGQAFRKASALKAHVRLHGKEPQRDLIHRDLTQRDLTHRDLTQRDLTQRDLTLLQPSAMILGAMPTGHTSAAPV